ncbi:hypothetical protein BJY00DRAFT_41299 [Aspergillus carlsbadensis]|nr:hypothetical protein BJY00DRAFT_41299 [Aspergillus carlsbadensis]
MDAPAHTPSTPAHQGPSSPFRIYVIFQDDYQPISTWATHSMFSCGPVDVITVHDIIPPVTYPGPALITYSQQLLVIISGMGVRGPPGILELNGQLGLVSLLQADRGRQANIAGLRITLGGMNSHGWCCYS